MGATFSRLKNWIAEILTYADLNAEIDNILSNLGPSGIDDHSTNTAQMQLTTDPGEVGTESLATSLAGEVQRLRFMIKEITGEAQWYESPGSSIAGLVNAIGTSLSANRLVSGRVRTTSDQPIFLQPHGGARTVTCKGATTSLVYFVNGVQYSITTDVTLTGLTAAPTINNTCSINDSNLAGQFWTRELGENGTEIPITAVGTEISNLAGKLAGFKVGTEYFIAEVGTLKLTNARRGWFFDSSDAPLSRTVLTHGDGITLMKLTWIFANTTQALTATYNPPTWSKDEPPSPATGDYWFDTDNEVWKRYDVSSFVTANATYIGMCLQDATNTVAARSHEFLKNYEDTNTLELVAHSNTQAKAREVGSTVNVWGNKLQFSYSRVTWDMTLDLESGVTENSSTYYYFYVTETGDVAISDKRPHDRREDLRGYYHPHQSWRCVGYAFNDGSSNLSDIESYYNRYVSTEIYPPQTALRNIEIVPRIYRLDTSGGGFTEVLPPAARARGIELIFVKATSDANIITLNGFGAETIAGSGTITTLATQHELIKLLSDGTSWLVTGRHIPSAQVTFTPTGNWTTATTYTGNWYRVGDRMHINYHLGLSTTPNNVGLVLDMPAGYTIDTTKLLSASSSHVMYGYYGNYWDTGTARYPLRPIYNNNTSFSVYWLNVPTSAVQDSQINATNPVTKANGDRIDMNIVVPITNWST